MVFRRFSRIWLLPPRRSASTFLSPVGQAFNSKPNFKIPHWTRPQAGLFQIPELVSHEGFVDLKEGCKRRTEELVAEATSANRTRIVTQVFDELSDELCRVADMAEYVRVAHPDSRYKTFAEDATTEISFLVDKLNTNRELFDALGLVVNNGDKFPETDVDQHVAKLFLHDFLQNGIHLEEQARQKTVQLTAKSLQLGHVFCDFAHSPRSVNKDVLPENLRHCFSVVDNQIVVAGLSDSSNDYIREASYKIFYAFDPRQESLLTDLVDVRHELAVLCGYETFAHRAMLDSLGETPENVMKFMETLSEKLKSRAQEEYNLMAAMKKRLNPAARPLQVWDMNHFSRVASNTDLRDNIKLTDYFSLGVCMDTLAMIFKSLFGVDLSVEEPHAGEIWHKHVYKLAVSDGNGPLGVIYCDFFARPGKPNQDCHFTIRGGRLKANGEYQDPVVVLMLNLAPHGWSKPTCLTLSQVDNLFHEMGHAMHSMLARTKYQHVTGTRCSTDFAEVPSTLMEYFASDPRILRKMARHYQSGDPLPDPLIEKISVSKKLFLASDLQTQMIYSLLDQRLHGKRPIGGAPVDVLKQVFEEHHCLPFPEGTAWHQRFTHINGYGAKYYSYLMARAVAASIWNRYFVEDPLCARNGAKYRDECLAHGGGKPSPKLVSDFLGKDMGAELLTDALVEEIDRKNRKVEKVRDRLGVVHLGS